MLRQVCKKMDQTSQRLLNQGFRSAERFHAKCLKDVKAKLPRRESERRNHRLSRHCDILTAIETRISLLSMTFIKFIEVNLCCFIPGKVIDEILSVLRIIGTDENPPRAYEILQELRDISSMAMEYFDDKIVPHFPTSPAKYSKSFTLNAWGMPLPYLPALPSPESTDQPDGISTSYQVSLDSGLRLQVSPGSSSRTLVTYPVSEPPRARRKLYTEGSERLSRTCQKSKKSSIITKLKKQAEMYKNTVEVQNSKIVDMDKKIDQQNEIIQQQNAKIAEQSEKIAAIYRSCVEGGMIAKVVENDEIRNKVQKRSRSVDGSTDSCSENKKIKL